MTWAAHVGMLSGLEILCYSFPGLSLALQPWAGISQRLRRYCRLRSSPGLELASAFGVIVIAISKMSPGISKLNRPHLLNFARAGKRQHNTKPNPAAVHLFVGFCHTIDRILFDHRMYIAQRAEFQCVL